MNKFLENKMMSLGMVVVVVLIAVVGYMIATGKISVGGGDKVEVPEGFIEIKIGSISPLGGDAADYGEQLTQVLDYQIEKVNKEAAGQNIIFTLHHEDGRCDSKAALDAYNKLKSDGVKFIIGGFCSSETLSIGSRLRGDNILALSPGSSNPKIEGLSTNLFSLSYTDELIGAEIANQMTGYKKVAMITEENDFNIGILNKVEEKLAQVNPRTTVVSERFSKGGTEFRTLLEKVKNAQPEVLLLNPNAGKTAENLLKQMKEIGGWENIQLIGQFSYMSDKVISIAPEMLEGMIIIDSPAVASSKFDAIMDDIKHTKGEMTSIGKYYTASALDTVQFLTDSILENVNLEGSGVVDGIVSVESVRDTIVDRRHRGYNVGVLDFTNTNFSYDIGAGMYMVENGTAVFKNNLLNAAREYK